MFFPEILKFPRSCFEDFRNLQFLFEEEVRHWREYGGEGREALYDSPSGNQVDGLPLVRHWIRNQRWPATNGATLPRIGRADKVLLDDLNKSAQKTLSSVYRRLIWMCSNIKTIMSQPGLWYSQIKNIKWEIRKIIFVRKKCSKVIWNRQMHRVREVRGTLRVLLMVYRTIAKWKRLNKKPREAREKWCDIAPHWSSWQGFAWCPWEKCTENLVKRISETNMEVFKQITTEPMIYQKIVKHEKWHFRKVVFF